MRSGVAVHCETCPLRRAPGSPSRRISTHILPGTPLILAGVGGGDHRTDGETRDSFRAKSLRYSGFFSFFLNDVGWATMGSLYPYFDHVTWLGYPSRFPDHKPVECSLHWPFEGHSGHSHSREGRLGLVTRFTLNRSSFLFLSALWPSRHLSPLITSRPLFSLYPPHTHICYHQQLSVPTCSAPFPFPSL